MHEIGEQVEHCLRGGDAVLDLCNTSRRMLPHRYQPVARQLLTCRSATHPCSKLSGQEHVLGDSTIPSNHARGGKASEASVDANEVGVLSPFEHALTYPSSEGVINDQGKVSILQPPPIHE